MTAHAPTRAALADALRVACEHTESACRAIVEDSGERGVLVSLRYACELTPAELWEALATRGVIPDAWIGDERRAFAEPCALCGATGRYSEFGPAAPCHGCNGARVVTWEHPPTVAACVAVAADVPGVLTAEALARQNCGAHLRVVWTFRDAEGAAAARRITAAWAGKAPDAFAEWARAMLATGYVVENMTREDIFLMCPALRPERPETRRRR